MTIFFGSVVGAIIGLIVKLITGKDYIPFGPFLSVGALIAMLFGQQLLFWYWNLVAPPL
jgi:leader peptidase (prepilin peptidase)/N-methyltransferase